MPVLPMRFDSSSFTSRVAGQKPVSDIAPNPTASAGSPTAAARARNAFEIAVRRHVVCLSGIADQRRGGGKQNEIVEFILPASAGRGLPPPLPLAR